MDELLTRDWEQVGIVTMLVFFVLEHIVALLAFVTGRVWSGELGRELMDKIDRQGVALEKVSDALQWSLGGRR